MMTGGPLKRHVWWIMLIVFAILMLGGCKKQQGYYYGDLSDTEWKRHGKWCRRVDQVEGPRQRVINRTDPELCGLDTYHRPKHRIRVAPGQVY